MSRTAVPFVMLAALSGCMLNDSGYEPEMMRPAKVAPSRAAWLKSDGTPAADASAGHDG